MGLCQQSRQIHHYGAEAVKVISCFTNMLQEELKNDKKANQQYKDSINNVIQILKDCLHDNEITSEERIQIRDKTRA